MKKYSYFKTRAGYYAEIWFNEDVGVYCGYVILTENHTLFGCNIDKFDSISVHGGITFCDKYVCPKSRETDKSRWKIGFDCGHFGDKFLNDNLNFSAPNDLGSIFRDFDYVKNECENLAFQLKDCDEYQNI